MTPKQKAYELTAATVIKNLEKRGMEAYYCPDKGSAKEKALGLIKGTSTISWGGSMSLEESGILSALKETDHTLIDRTIATTPAEKKELYGKAAICDYYFMSSNAISLDGQLINIDGFGNRVACLIAGPDNVIIVAGMNKLVTSVEDGIDRIRNFATPSNTVRLNKATPCATYGVCRDCYVDDCICNQIVITRRSGIKNRIKVILVGEELGY